jgi:hypothetical protein
VQQRRHLITQPQPELFLTRRGGERDKYSVWRRRRRRREEQEEEEEEEGGGGGGGGGKIPSCDTFLAADSS